MPAEKAFVGRRPKTTYHLTKKGECLLQAISTLFIGSLRRWDKLEQFGNTISHHEKRVGS